MGDATLYNFLVLHELLPTILPETDVYVVLVGDVFAKAQKQIGLLREMSVRAAVDVSGRKMDKQIKAAVKKGIKYVLFIGEQELESGQFTLKNLQTGTEETHSIERLVSIIKDYRQV
jgi:histidyl-tRNA synthetase